MSYLTIHFTDVRKTHYLLMQITLSDVDTFLEFYSQKIAMFSKPGINGWISVYIIVYCILKCVEDILFSLVPDRCKIVFQIFKFSCKVLSDHDGKYKFLCEKDLYMRKTRVKLMLATHMALI